MDRVQQIEQGDFQTPRVLTDPICKFLVEQGATPRTIVEPTCGTGTFLRSCLEFFPSCETLYGFDIEQTYIDSLTREYAQNTNVTCRQQDFFTFDWEDFVQHQKGPILIIGNPPWVTNATIGSMKGTNLPTKSNFLRLNGLDALTGKSNFDISEWMLLRMISALKKKQGIIAMLCKTSVARKVLTYCWSRNIATTDSKIVLVDARAGFNVSVDACLLYLALNYPLARTESAEIFTGFQTKTPVQTIGHTDGMLVSNMRLYQKYRHLAHRVVSGNRWRTGIKHDCSSVMELRKIKQDVYVNGFGEEIELEPTYIFPLMKSSDVANSREPTKWVIVPQRAVGDDTQIIQRSAPRTWRYLVNHSAYFEKRGSKIYRGRPRFSIFGIGEYSFLPWKIAISGFYKSTTFRLIGEYEHRPVMFDDTVNFLGFHDQQSAKEAVGKLNAHPAQALTRSLTFWDAKRPITTALLSYLV